MNYKMELLMQTGLTIAGISQEETHPTVFNYQKFGGQYWDDSQKNGSKIGYYFAYYFQKKFVYIHKIIDILQPAQRPTCMEWESDRQILCLSEQLKAFTWNDWVNGPGQNAPYTSNYPMLPTTAWSYSDLKQHKKFNTFQFIQFKQCVDTPIQDEMTGTEDDEINRLEERIRIIKARREERQANEKLVLLRTTKCNEIQTLIEEMQETIKSLTQKQIDYRNGHYDKELG